MDWTILKPLLQTSFSGIVGFIFLTSFIAADRTFPAKTLNLTMAALLCAFFLLTADFFNFYFMDLSIKYRYAENLVAKYTSIRKYFLMASFVFKVATSGCTVALSQRFRPKNVEFLYAIMIVNAGFSVASIFTGCVFDINPVTFEVIHGKFYVVPYIAIILNICFLLYSGYKNLRSNPGEAIVIVAMCLFPWIATLCEVKFNMRLMLPLSFIVCVIFYFMCLNVQLYRRDTLTNLLNRRSFYIDSKRNLSHNLTILSMDLNDLKVYNDTQGHAAGDLAIKTSVDCMIKAFSKLGVIYRTGGDEFMGLLKDVSGETAVDAVCKFQKMLSETPYRVACGISEYEPGDDFDKMVSDSDAKMYRHKMTLKAQKMAEAEARGEKPHKLEIR